MICPVCDTYNPPEATFCSSCSSPFSRPSASASVNEEPVSAISSQVEPPEETIPDPAPAAVPLDEPVAPTTPKQRQSRLKIILVAVLVVLLLGDGSSIAAFVHSATRPQPSIRLSSL